MSTPEHSIQNSIRLALSERGYYTERINVGRGYLLDTGTFSAVKQALRRAGELKLLSRLHELHPFSTGAVKGRSDLSAIKDGKIYFIEVKNEVGRPSEDQLNFIDQMQNRYHCGAGIARSVEDALKICQDSGDPDGWRKTSDELPPEGVRCRLWYRDKFHEDGIEVMGSYDFENWHIFGCFYPLESCAYWKPQDNPPKEHEKE